MESTSPPAKALAIDKPGGMDDLKLVEAVLRKDRKATAELVALHADAVYAYIYHRLAPRVDLVEDTVQEVFLAAWENLSKFQGASSLRSWLIGIARHKVEDYYRARLREPQPIEANEEAHAQDYETSVVVSGLTRPTGIAVKGSETVFFTVSLLLANLNRPVGIALDHKGENLYWTEVPTPGISGSMGGSNSVKELNLETMKISEVAFGDPEPTDIAVARNGNVFWTCTSAGVIVEARRKGGKSE